PVPWLVASLLTTLLHSAFTSRSELYELYPIPCVKKRSRKIVRVPERLYRLVLKHLYQPRNDQEMRPHFEVYPISLDLSREVYPNFVRFSFIRKYQQGNEHVSWQQPTTILPHSNKDRKIGYTVLDRSMRSVYNKNKEEQYA
ncbi:MAG TPA: hypothetical protein VJQ26_07450, partial [Ktedonobacteraceae bacterium]|nr:hypothetical protein [Ktedonobacteraceae bacterium]